MSRYTDAITGAIIGGLGAYLVFRSNFLIGLGVFLMIWGNNMARSGSTTP